MKSKTSHPSVRTELVKRLAAGETQQSISKDMGILQQTISTFSRKEEIRSLIELERMRLAEIAPDAVKNVADLVREMPIIPKGKIKQRELAYKASRDVLKATGVFPSPSINIMSVYNDNREVVIEPRVFDLIQRVTTDMLKLPDER